MKKIILTILIALTLPSLAFAVQFRGSGGTFKMIGWGASTYDFTISQSSRQDLISGASSGNVTTNDVINATQTGATFDTAADLSLSSVQQRFLMPVYTSVDPTIASVDQNGKVSRVSDGTTKINVLTPATGGFPQLTKQTSVTVARTTGQTTSTFYDYAAGSVSKEAATEMDAKMAGKTGTDANTKLFSTDDAASATYVWNTNNFLYGVDMTMISPWNDNTEVNNNIEKAGVLITPRHLVQAHHFLFSVGDHVRFIKQDGTVITRTITGVAQVSHSGNATDIAVDLLDSDVPAGISFAKILPSTYASYFPSIGNSNTSLVVPAIGMLGGGFGGLSSIYPQGHLHKQATEKDLYSLQTGAFPGADFKTSASSTRNAFQMDNVIVGDSGNASFLLLNSQLILLSTWSGASPGQETGPNYAAYGADINTAITSLGSNPNNYQVTTVDLSAFNTY